MNHRVRRVSPDGVVTTVAGSSSGYADAVGPSARFFNSVGVAVGPDGALVVGDAFNHRIRRID